MLPSGILLCCTGPFWSDSLWLFGFCLPSLRCLISTLTQAGRGGLLFRFASSVQSCCGEGGALQTDIAVCGEHSPCSGHTGFARYRGVCAFLVYTAQAPGCSIWSGSCVECGSSFRVLHKSADSVAPVFCAFPGLRGTGSQMLGALSMGAPRLFPPRPQHALPDGFLQLAFVQRSWPLAATLLAADVDHQESQEVFRQEPGPICRVGGGGFSGAEFAPFPSPLPPTSSGDGPALLCSFSVPLFANRRRCVPAG